jgi:hypothetical protein
VLDLLLTDPFAAWFAALEDAAAEDVATALDVVEQLGATQAPPASREALLWYEHPTVAEFEQAGSLAWQLEEWGAFHDYAQRILAKLESPRFVARLARLGTREATQVLSLVRSVKRVVNPRMRWALRAGGLQPRLPWVTDGDPCAELRRRYLEVLAAAGFEVTDVPAYSAALRELSRRAPSPAYRLLYGVDVRRGVALFVLGEWLDRSFYGDSVRRAERMWRAYLAGDLHTTTPSEVR